jgi:hypothetical protein
VKKLKIGFLRREACARPLHQVGRALRARLAVQLFAAPGKQADGSGVGRSFPSTDPSFERSTPATMGIARMAADCPISNRIDYLTDGLNTFVVCSVIRPGPPSRMVPSSRILRCSADAKAVTSWSE